ncbi:hypothetical protein BC477_09985 [Clavibacter michiganensis subsp. michiganensis]|uniref:Uncharacterized protein n=1 Tax=Clavibacter michiganensis subsp. michiganensis TaxID=33013 RepID=A0A251XNP6_CLAMM|nr:hypothetical protein BC477_09985 [Clavibacter michiganensis subsp. michiganensis]OUE05056.1 hypothetical protein CMMCAS07_08905 [Clavibacter michiganensis subsp. michiganensis]
MLADLALPVPLAARVDGVILRRATVADLAELMRLLADDPVSAGRGDRADPGDADLYRDALARILADPRTTCSSRPTRAARSSARCSSRGSPAWPGAAPPASRWRPCACGATCVRPASAAP